MNTAGVRKQRTSWRTDPEACEGLRMPERPVNRLEQLLLHQTPAPDVGPPHLEHGRHGQLIGCSAIEQSSRLSTPSKVAGAPRGD